METFLQDVRYAARTLRKSPGFTAVAVLCLALGIATNTTLFSCFNAIVLRPFPFTDPERLVAISDRDARSTQPAAISYPTYIDWRDESKSFTEMAAYSGRSLAITEGEEPARLNGQAVSANLFPMLGVKPQVGRLFRPDEDTPGAAGTVLLSDGVWKRLYAADSAVVGRTISVNNLPYTVVGVMPQQFKFPERSEIWIPMTPLMSADKREWRSSNVIGRLRPGVDVKTADRELIALSKRLKTQYGIVDDLVGNVRELRADFLPEDVKLITATMMGAVMFVLLIACANVANLMLTRAAGRQRELAIRAAIGAGRGRIMRQLLTEAVIIAVVAGVLALPLTLEGIELIKAAIPAENPMPYYMVFSVDRPTLIYTAVVSLIAGVLFGLAPALQASRSGLHEALKDGARGAGAGVRSNRLRSALVVAEVALSLVLLIGASLFVRTFSALQSADVGFNTAPIMTMRFFLPGQRYDSTTARVQLVEDVVRRVEALPGVEAATISNMIPINGGGAGDGVVIEGVPVEKGRERTITWTGVTAHWSETLGARITSGRALMERDMHDSARVAVIDQTMATRFWPSKDPVGKRFRLVSDSTLAWFTVVGVSANIRTTGLSNTGPERANAFVAYRLLSVRNNGLVIRSRGVPTAVTAAAREALRGADPGLPVFSVATMEKVRELSYWQYKLFGAMFATFGAIALFLAAIGVYGVISEGVARRTREIGVRVALGAQRGDVIGLVVRQGMLLAGIGIAAGLAGSFGVTRVVASLLIGISPTDPVSFLGVALFLAAVAFVASVIPARRATGVDPIVALRAE